jgi:hypothetical protein
MGEGKGEGVTHRVKMILRSKALVESFFEQMHENRSV